MPQKDSYDFEAKRIYRQKLRDFIAKYYPRQNHRKNLRVACLPGHEALEVTEVYDRLGVPRQSIWGIEHDGDAVRALRSRKLGIKIYEGDVESFFQGKPDVRGNVFPQDELFDVINLDFQGRLKSKEDGVLFDVFNPFVHKPNFILGTNFYGSRENDETKDRYRAEVVSLFTKGKFRDPRYSDKVNFANNRIKEINTGNLDQLRSDFIASTLYSLIWGYRPEDVINRAGKSFRAQIEEEGLNFEEVIANPNAFLDQIFKIGRYNQRLLEQCVHMAYPNFSDSDAQWFSSFIEYTSAIMPLCLDDFVKGRYVSDNGAPMFFDFLRLRNTRTSFLPPAIVALNLGDSIQIDLREEDYDRQLNLFTKMILLGNNYMVADREEITPTKLGDRVRKDLAAGISEEEVMRRYELTRMQLGGYKAALSRINGNGGNGKKKGNENLVRLGPEDEEAVAEFIASGIPTQEICATYGLTNMQVAARKAKRTRMMRGAV